MTWPSATDPLLLEAASTQRVDEFAATVRVWKADADRDLDGRRRAAHQHTWRKACWHTGPDGMVHVRADLAPDAGAIVTGALHTISERLWRDERVQLIEKNDLARQKVEAMILRLKSLEHDS